MPKFLAIDADASRLHIALCDNGAVVRSLSVSLDHPLSPDSAESVGKKVRESLKASGLSPAPIVGCVGRDQVVAKELRHPAVAEKDEAALVRFQASRELGEGDLVLDYVPMPVAGIDRQSLVVGLRKGILATWQNLAKSLGVKLEGLTARPFALAAMPLPGASKSPAVLVAFDEKWAELLAVEANQVLLTRSLSLGGQIANEIRRSLTALPSAKADAIETLYVADLHPSAELMDKIAQASELMTVSLKTSGSEASLAGLAKLQGKLPINFVKPRAPVATGDPNLRRRLILGGAAAALVLGIIGVLYAKVAEKRSLVDSLIQQKADLDKMSKMSEQDRVDFKALKEWNRGAIPWLDELYDLAARFPDAEGFKIKAIRVQPKPPKSEKDPTKSERDPVAEVVINGETPKGRPEMVNQLIEALKSDAHLDARIESRNSQDFTVKIDVAKQDVGKYQVKLIAPKRRPIPKPEPEPTTADDDGVPGVEP